jgi:transcriptional regulator with PAS, ATPase and Fis domain
MDASTKINDFLIRSLVESHSEPFALIDENFTIVACNRRYAEAYTHLTPGEIVGMKCHEVSHKSADRCDLAGDECPLDMVRELNRTVHVMHKHFDYRNQPYYVSVSGYPIHAADPQQVTYVGEAMIPVSREEELHFEEERMVGCCPSFIRMLDGLALVAQADMPVLINGETGTGKELAALFLHRKSTRADGEFLTIDCTTLSDEMFVAELFGHEAGAYTGCIGAKRGLVELAERGTLFLDEIGEISLEIQAKLLRVLDRGTFRRLGGTQERKVDFRLICATNRDLRQLVAEGRFRADLYFRINSMQVTLPPLRERRGDIPSLVTFFLRRMNPARPSALISGQALQLLQDYSYPGNVRELKHALECAVLMSRGEMVEPAHLPPEISDGESWASGLTDAASEGERPGSDAEQIRAALRRFAGNRRRTAAFLQISERTLYRRLKDFDLS